MGRQFSGDRFSNVVKLYAFYTPSHRVLKDEWFLPTLQDDYELVLKEYEQECSSGEYKSNGWRQAMFRKAELVIQGIKENWSDLFVYSDVDVQFFGPTMDFIFTCMEGKDMAFQRDSPEGGVCAGFFSCRANERTLKLWQDIRRGLLENQGGDDQDVLNHLLLRSTNGPSDLKRRIAVRVARHFSRYHECFIYSLIHTGNPYRIKWTYFPKEFFGGGTLTGRQWQPGMPLEIPKDIVLHHANWTVGLANKIAQLKFVQNVANRKIFSKFT